MRSGRVGRLGWAAIGLAAVVELTTVVLAWGFEPAYETLGYAVASLAMVGAGTLILARQPGNRIGWLFLAIGLLDPVTGELAHAWGVRAGLNGWPGGSTGEVIGTATWPLGGFGWMLVFLLFPDGRLVSPGWRIVPWIGAIGAVVVLAGWVPSPDRGEEFVQGTNPLAAPDLPTSTLFAVGGLLFGAALLASAASLVVRFRRSTGVLRQQLKWFAYAGAFAGTVLPVTVALWTVWPPVHVLVPVAILSLPVGAYVAILRHRLYDIDLLINQTAVYAVVTVLIAAAYAVTAVMLGTKLGQGTPWATAGATLVAAVAFRPVRNQVQDAIDRRFRRSRYEAARRLADFNEALRAGDAAPEEVQHVLAEVLDDPALEILYAGPDGDVYLDSAGRPTEPDLTGRRQTVVERGGQRFGLVIHRMLAEDEEGVLATAVEGAGLAIEMSRLRVELRGQLAEVEASRQRIVEAGNEERRRLERNLHDGAQQRLMSIGLTLRHAEHELRNGRTVELGGTLDAVVGDVSATISELRRLARGLPPPQLDAGLGPAFRELSARSPVPVELTAPAERFDRTLEAAAYFIGCEGFTNAVRHARASRIELSAARDNGTLVIMVADDGVGGADPSGGSGLRGLADRVAAMGGTIRVDSSPHRGTRITAELPCGS